MSSDEVELKVDASEKPCEDVTDAGAASPEGAQDQKDGAGDEVVVAQEESGFGSSKPARANPTILSEMCNHRKPDNKPPSFEQWKKSKEEEKFKNEPLQTTCEKCEKEVTTEIEYSSGVCTRLTCLCFFCCIPILGQLGLCFVPFCTNFSKIREHKCPECQAVLHTRAGTWDC